MKKFLASFLAVFLLSLPVVAQAGTVTVKGSDTMVIMVQRWAEEFMKKNPDTKLQVTGGGSGTGISALINGTTDICMASRPMKEAETEKLRSRFNTTGTEIAVAKDGVTFYVSEKNPLNSLTMDQLKGIYLGDITTGRTWAARTRPSSSTRVRTPRAPTCS